MGTHTPHKNKTPTRQKTQTKDKHRINTELEKVQQRKREKCKKQAIWAHDLKNLLPPIGFINDAHSFAVVIRKHHLHQFNRAAKVRKVLQVAPEKA